MCKLWKNYLFWFAQEHVEFRFNEISSIIQMFNIEVRNLSQIKPEIPFWIVQLPNDECAKKITTRSVLLKYCLELWSHSLSGNFNELVENLKKFTSMNYFQSNLANNSFKISIETYGNHISWDTKMEKLNKFNFLPLNGSVDLTNCQMHINYIEYYGLHHKKIDEPLQIFFGHKLCGSGRHLIKDFTLKSRKFIASTSMEPGLSFLMVNQAQVQPNQLVLDPFVGSGSLLVSSAYYGAYVIGSDIDYMKIHAKTKPSRINQKIRDKDESIFANLKQYNLQSKYIDVIINDFSRRHWRDDFVFDAIITDPPYGIRESSKKIGSKKLENGKKNSNIVPPQRLNPYFPGKIPYNSEKLFSDLLNFAAKHLKLDGKLVFWFPVLKNGTLTENSIPEHSSLMLIGNSLQVLNTYVSRRLLTYKKI